MAALGSELTAAQQRVLDLLEEELRREGRAPTVRELAERLGQANHQGVQRILGILEAKGYIERRSDIRRGLRLTYDRDEEGIPLIGAVAAGSPILAVENIEKRISLPADFFRQRPDYFLRVRGDSMIDAGIFDGDLVAVKKAARAEFGAIVVARVGEEATLKRLGGTPDEPRLLAENPAYAPIELRGRDWCVEGIYLGLIRRG
ncbi:MAG: transcriptional repressor LexA [Gammaproteobacteria bacterium]|nr:transcriptional repressor LexA [Gammaproteobacteria bacterium]